MLQIKLIVFWKYFPGYRHFVNESNPYSKVTVVNHVKWIDT